MNKKPIVIKDLLNYKYPENLQYSPSGKYLAFQVGKANEKKNSYDRDIWLVKDGKADKFTSTNDSKLVFWDDDKTMVITRGSEDDIPGQTKLYKLSVDGGEAKEWITLPFVLGKIDKVDNNHYVAKGMIDVNDPDAYKDNEETTQRKLKEKNDNKDYEVIDELPYWWNGRGFINKQRLALFEIKVGDKLEVKRITAKDFSVDEYLLCDKNVYFIGKTIRRHSTMFTKLFAYNINSKKIETIFGENGLRLRNLVYLKNELYVQVDELKKHGLNETGVFMRVNKNGFEYVLDPERQLFDSLVGDTTLGGGKEKVIKNNNYYTLATEEDHVEIWKFDSSFKKTVLFDKKDGIFFFDVSDKKIAFARETENSLCEIYEMDLSGKNIKQITNLNTEVLKDKYIAKPHVINYTSEGYKLHGWVLLPENFNPKKKYPAVLDIHGGPRCIYGNIFFHEMQVWASKGYVVMFTNIRGSDGRGDEFADIRDEYGNIDYKNLMDFVDVVLEKYPNIDKKRLCETGGSYGGFMTNWIIGHTDRFCCAASQRSISNWISFSYVSDIGIYFGYDQCGATGNLKEEDFAKMWDKSPLKYAKNVKTPTLFIHSDEDYRCPLPEGLQMMQALASQNVETRLVMFKGENHELSRSGKPLHRIRRLEEITNWFDIHTKK